MSETLSKEVVLVNATMQLEACLPSLEFITQDDEYKTMGWVCFNRLLTALYNCGFFNKQRRKNNTHLCVEEICETLTLNPSSLPVITENWAKCRGASGKQTENENDYNFAQTRAKALLDMNIITETDNEDYSIKSPSKLKDHIFQPNKPYMINKHFLKALILDNETGPYMKKLKQAYGLDRHEEAINFYCNVFFRQTIGRPANSELLIPDLVNHLRDMEYYIGREDPDPSQGIYTGYRAYRALPIEL